MMKRISINIFVMLMLLLQSCIDEDTSDCESGLLLRFRYTLNNQYTNLFDSSMKRVTIYLFDDKGKYVDSFMEQGSLLTNDYVMRIPLPQGKYNAVVYGGDFGTYWVGELDSLNNTLNSTLRKGVTDMTAFRTELKSISGAESYLYPVTIPDDLYAGLALNIASAPGNSSIRDVELISDTKKVKVKISGTNIVGVPVNVYITALNGRYKFGNNIDLNHTVFKYTPIRSSVRPDSLEVDLKMMRIVLGQSPMLVIKNSVTSEVIYNENIVKQILLTQKYVSQTDLDREDEFVFEINLQSKDHAIEVSVSINGWKISNINTDI